MIASCTLAACDVFFPLTGPGVAEDAGVDAAEDLDNDGVAEGDNCPKVANPDQHDEDDDQVGDACDNCPHLTNPGQENSLELVPDDLGDACDVDPSTQCILLFDPLTTRPATTFEFGTWQIDSDGDSLIQLDLGLDDALFVMPGQYTAEVVVVGARLLGFTTGDGQFHNVGIWHAVGSISTGVPQGVVAEYSSARNAADVGPAVMHVGQPALAATVGTADFDPPVTTSTIGVGSDVMLRIDMRSPGNITARADVDISFATVTNSLQAPLPAGNVGLRTFNTQSRFHYVLVFQDRGSACPPRP